MKRVNRSFTLLSAMMLAVVLGLSACVSSPTSKSTGEMVDDGVLTTKVNAALARDESVMSAIEVDVESYRGTVQLSGFVDSEEQIQQIVDIVENVSGVQEVKNSLQIKPTS